MIESVVESLLQLLIQSILVYVVLGPGAGLGWHFFATLYFDQPHVKIFKFTGPDVSYLHSTFNLLTVQRFSEKNYIDFAASSHPIDISSMLFQSTKERLLYGVLLVSSFFSVCISFSK